MHDTPALTMRKLPSDQNRFRLSRGLLELARDRHGYYETNEFAKAMGLVYVKGNKRSGQVTADTIRNLWKKPTGMVNADTVNALIDFLHLDPNDVISDIPRPYYLEPIPVPKDYSWGERVGDRHSLYIDHIDDGRYATEMKLVLAEDGRSFSEALLAGTEPPSFFEILRKLRFMLLPSEKLKDIQMTDLDYNHFVSASVIVQCNLPNSNRDCLFGYMRRRSAESPMSNLQTQGFSTLWSSAFPVNTKGINSLMDYWLDTAAKDPKQARYDLLDRPYPWLLRLLDHKISLYGYDREISEPFGVITNDMRPLGKKKVYTQYVFHLQIDLPQDDLARAYEHLCRYGDYGRRIAKGVPIDPAYDHVFNDEKGGSARTNHMDLLSWQALMSMRPSLSSGYARFTRGFALI